MGVVRGFQLLDDNVPAEKLRPNAITLIVPVLGILEQSGLAADSTGVKYEGPRFKVKTAGLKSAKIRATWTASHSDSETAIELYDVTAGSVVGSVSGNTGTDVESDDLKDGITEGNLLELRVNVTTASATSGATTDVKYAVLELEYGWS